METKINPTEVLNTLDTAIEALENGYQPELLTEEEQKRVDKKFDDVIKLALKVKLQYQQRRLEKLIQSLDNDDVDVMQVKATSMKIENAFNIIDEAA
jgi:ribosome assembly protein YihI (activator of Der GTPase)